jgi:hypothetical protein
MANPKIQAYSGLGLYATWAAVGLLHQHGVEHYLADQLDPLVGERHPDDHPIPVNLPWGG